MMQLQLPMAVGESFPTMKSLQEINIVRYYLVKR